MRGLEGGQDWDWDQRSSMEGSEWQVTSRGQWLVRNIGVIRESRECQNGGEKGKKAILSHFPCENPVGFR